MGTITIDGRKVEFTDEKNVLSIIRKAGIDLPTLCYHSELSTYGACRLCTVEDDRRKDVCVLFGRAKRWNGDLYQYAEIEKIPEINCGTAFGISQQRLYYLREERRM